MNVYYFKRQDRHVKVSSPQLWDAETRAGLFLGCFPGQLTLMGVDREKEFPSDVRNHLWDGKEKSTYEDVP